MVKKQLTGKGKGWHKEIPRHQRVAREAWAKKTAKNITKLSPIDPEKLKVRNDKLNLLPPKWYKSTLSDKEFCSRNIPVNSLVETQDYHNRQYHPDEKLVSHGYIKKEFDDSVIVASDNNSREKRFLKKDVRLITYEPSNANFGVYQHFPNKVYIEGWDMKFVKDIPKTNPYKTASDESVIEELQNIEDFLEVRVDDVGHITNIGLKPDISFKDFHKYFPDITEKNLIKLFDSTEGRNIMVSKLDE